LANGIPVVDVAWDLFVHPKCPNGAKVIYSVAPFVKSSIAGKRDRNIVGRWAEEKPGGLAAGFSLQEHGNSQLTC